MDILPPFKKLVPSFPDGTPIEVRYQEYYDGPALVIRQGPDVVVLPLARVPELGLALVQALEAHQDVLPA